jgi:hypothetical protein
VTVKRPLDRAEWTTLIAFAAVVFALSAPLAAACTIVTPEAIESGRVRWPGPCPSCGMTRGLAAAGHGRFRAAWRYHPAAPVLFVIACAAACGSLATLFVAARRRRTAPADWPMVAPSRSDVQSARDPG